MEISKYFYLISANDAQHFFPSFCMYMRSVQFSENYVSPAVGGITSSIKLTTTNKSVLATKPYFKLGRLKTTLKVQ